MIDHDFSPRFIEFGEKIMSFRCAGSNFSDFDEQRKVINKSVCTFGNSFLDDSLTGIFPDDLVVLTAKTGAGKTEIATQIAFANALKGKRVHLFALEAYEGEIQTRIKYKTMAQAFFLMPDWRRHNEVPSYQEWVYGRQGHLLDMFSPEVNILLEKQLKNLNIYYRNKDFNINTFEAQMAMIGTETDLVIVDHLHYFDFDTENENQDLRRTMKQIRDLTMFYRKPTVLVAHIRKQDKRYQSHIPDLEDIYGSSDISKVATKIVAAAPAKDVEQDENKPYIFPTYLKVLKNRLDGSRTNFAAVSGFNIQENKYEDNYAIGKVNTDGKFESVKKVPQWAKHSFQPVTNEERSRGNVYGSFQKSNQFRDD